MKTKKKTIIVVSVIIVLAAVLCTVFSSSLHNAIFNLGVPGYLNKDLSNPNGVNLIAHSVKIEEQSNSVAGVKEAVRLGADAVVVDLCFKSDGTPVMADNYEKAKTAPLIEDLFKVLNEEKYIDTKVILNIVQLSDFSVLNKLAVKYNVVPRLTIIGIDKEHYGLITGDDTIIPFYLDYEFTSDDLSAVSDGTFATPEIIQQYKASGLVIDRTDCSEKTVNALDDMGIPFIVTNIKNGSQLCKVLSDNVKNVYVDNIEKSNKIFNDWVAKMQSRFEVSIEKSLKELSTKKGA